VAKTKTKAPQKKQPANVYTMMLIVSFLALSIGSFILYRQLEKYEWDREALQRPRGAVVTSTAAFG